MITPARILNKYNSFSPYLDLVRLKVRDSLQVLCDLRTFALVSRIKSLESVSEKVETGRFKDWSQIEDLVALTVVIPTLEQEDVVLEFLERAFDKIEVRRRGSTLKAPDVFRFDSTRFIGRLTSQNEASHGPLHDIPFEVQIKSAFEHAWTVTTHALGYKSPDVNWSKLRLTAQLKAAVEQLDTLVLSFTDASKFIQPSVWPEIDAKSALRNYFNSFIANGKIPAELAPKDWSRFIDNVYGLVKSHKGSPKPQQVAETVSSAFDAELSGIGVDKVPRSISLWQLTFVSLVKAGYITSDSESHWPLITPELEDLYPAVREFQRRFDYS